jgi:hypothetical protein
MKGASWTQQSRETKTMSQPLYGVSEVSAEHAEIEDMQARQLEAVVLQCRGDKLRRRTTSTDI